MITLEKTATPLHTMQDAEVVAMARVWYEDGILSLSGNDNDGYVQAAGFYSAYVQEMKRRRVWFS